MNDRINFVIKEHIGVIKEHETGWRKEINMVSWNGNAAKLDIRDWDPNHEFMSKGMTLNEKELEKILGIIKEKGPEIRAAFDREKPQLRGNQDRER